MLNSKERCSWWTILLALLIFSSIASVLYGGLNGLMKYRKSMEPSMPVNHANIRFFTKEYLMRLYQRLSSEALPVETSLPSFYLYADDKSLESLESDLPASGKSQFKQGHIKVDNPALSSEVQFRYRGGLPLHWMYQKKSLRIKLPPYTTYRGERQFNLVNPTTIHTITDWLSYDMSRSLGLLTPEYFPARVFINNQNNGVHFFLSRIDESFLRKNNRMPGSIYSGDTIYVPNPFGADNSGRVEVTYADEKTGISYMWKEQRLWKKNASRNAESEHNRKDLIKFLDLVNADPVQFMAGFDRYFNAQKFYLFWGLDTLVGSYHHDLFHNHKIYFDPYKGKFEPIEWDVRFWTTSVPSPEYPLLKQVMLNPVLDFERNLILFQLWKKFSVTKINDEIDKKNELIIDEMAADPFRQQPDSYFNTFTINKVIPFSMEEYHNAIDELKLIYRQRHKVVLSLLESSQVAFSTREMKDKSVQLIVEVDGNSAIDINLWSLFSEDLTDSVSIQRILNSEVISKVKRNSVERLYPGKRKFPGNALGRADMLSSLTYGKEHLEPAPLYYQYRIQGLALTDLKRKGFAAVSAITSKKLKVYAVDKLQDDTETDSVHPWKLPLPSPESNVTLSGVIDINQDRVYTKYQSVTILPGTIFNIAKGKSLIFYGKVSAVGTESSPVVFKQKSPGQAWGSLIIQGEASSGSELSYILVSGGSVTTQHLINYSGQVNIHDVSDFTLSHCLIKDNSVGDDALHVSYSKGEINQCRFENTAFDALDMDIVQVRLSDSIFINAGNDAIDLMNSEVSMDGISISGAGDKCFSIGENSQVDIFKSELNNCQTGIAVKDGSQANVEDLVFRHIKDDPISLYRKNQRYGQGGRIAGRQLYGIRAEDVLINDGSQSDIEFDQFLPLP